MRGYHQCSTVIQRLVALGHSTERVRAELRYLLRARCITAEHQRLDELGDEDLVSISSTGGVQIDILSSVDYLSACAEDIYFSDRDAAERVARRIGQSRGAHFSEVTVLDNAEELVNYLAAHAKSSAVPTASYLSDDLVEDLHDLREAADAVATARRQRHALRERGRLFIGNVFHEATEEDITGLFSGVGVELVDVYIPRDNDGIAKGRQARFDGQKGRFWCRPQR